MKGQSTVGPLFGQDLSLLGVRGPAALPLNQKATAYQDRQDFSNTLKGYIPIFKALIRSQNPVCASPSMLTRIIAWPFLAHSFIGLNGRG